VEDLKFSHSWLCKALNFWSTYIHTYTRARARTHTHTHTLKHMHTFH
jgi:hypothetical protein